MMTCQWALSFKVGRHHCNVRSYFVRKPRSLFDSGLSPILALPSSDLRISELPGNLASVSDHSPQSLASSFPWGLSVP